MADSWQTFPLEFKGGLLKNISPLQQGINAPGSATVLQNFEPSIEGGYRKIEGFSKADDNALLGSGNVRGLKRFGGAIIASRGTQLYRSSGSGWTQISNSLSFPASTATAKVNGATSSTTTLVVDNNTGTIKVGMIVTGTGISTVTAKVNGATSDADALVVDNNVGTIAVGMPVTGTNIDGTVTVDSLSNQNNLVLSSNQTLPDNTDLTFSVTVSTVTDQNNLALSNAQSLSNNVDLTFTEKSPNLSGSGKVRFAEYNFTGTDKLFIVDGNGKPYIFTGTSLAQQTSLASDFAGADFVTVHLERLFVAIGTTIICSGAASSSSDNFSGSTSFEFDGTITDIITFREQLIVFSQNGIKKLTGKTNSDFAILPITDDVGAIASDTVQEVGGDVMFLAADGLRLLGATERIGDFSLAVVSKSIQPEFSKFTANSTSFSSLTIREKSQYRIFGYNAGFTDDSALGIIGTQFASQGGEGMAWAETRGINSFAATSSYDSETEFIYFANDDGYVYRLESGNSFDGDNISATYQSPFFPVNDPRIRKTFYKLILYTEPTGSVTTDVSLKLDFEKDLDFQPASISFSSIAEGTFFYNDSSALFAQTGLVNNGSGYSASATSIAVDTLTITSSSGLTIGDTFIIGTTTHTLTNAPTISGSAGSASSSDFSFTPGLAGTTADNTEIFFTKINGVGATSYGSANTQSQFESQLVGSGFTAALRITSEDTNPAFSLDSATLEYTTNERR